jgi:hypothetical protein
MNHNDHITRIKHLMLDRIEHVLELVALRFPPVARDAECMATCRKAACRRARICRRYRAAHHAIRRPAP